MADFAKLGPLMVGLGLLALLIQFERAAPKLVRASAAALCILLSVRYMWWRFEHSMPRGQNIYQESWAWLFFAFESLSAISAATVLFFMSRVASRKPPASAPVEVLEAPVDVFIVTYNESYGVIERTIVGALALEHRDLRVWVLDDGARDWLRDLAKELGALYLRRVHGAHAKAGNVNNGLDHALRAGRKPEFILLLDADFVPYRKLLKRTLGFFADQDVGIVQTPQHFFNADPIQSNLSIGRLWPDEQRFFFNTLLACKDAWGAAFCCGTSAVFRVEALLKAGGMAIETVTEDMLTSFKLLECGYRTILLNERLSMGLAPEGLSAYVSQRSRWCLGAIQQIYTRWSFLGPARINLINRLSALDGALYWISNAPFKLMMVLAPLVYWWTATAVIASTLGDLVRYLAPAVACSILFMGHFAQKRILPVMTDVTQLLTSFVVIATVAKGLARPFGHPFKVTEKGLATDHNVIHWRLLLPFATIATGTIAGVASNISQYSPLYGTEGYEVNVFWSVFNIAVLVIACAVSVEPPRRRADERFLSGEKAMLRLNSGIIVPCLIRDLSLGGANLAVGIGRLRAADAGTLVFFDGIEAPFKLVREVPGGAAVQFAHDAASRRELIAKLFTGGYDNDVPQINVGKVLAAVGKRLAR